jgi:hypothetical protein
VRFDHGPGVRGEGAIKEIVRVGAGVAARAVARRLMRGLLPSERPNQPRAR